MLRFVLEYLQGGFRAVGLRGADRRTEDRLLGVTAQVFEQGFVAGDKAASAGYRFRQAAANDVHLVGHAEVVGGAAPLIAQHTKAVGIVHHAETVVLRGDVQQLLGGGNMPFH